MTATEPTKTGYITVGGRRISIPTTDDVRSMVEDGEDERPDHKGLYGPMFDAWLARHDAELFADAPHSLGCHSGYDRAPDSCNCWKSGL